MPTSSAQLPDRFANRGRRSIFGLGKEPRRARRRTRRLACEILEPRQVLTAFGAGPRDTGEFMLGQIRVNVVLFESTGQYDANRNHQEANTENWTPALIQDIKNRIETAEQWWKDTLVNMGGGANPLTFINDYTFADNPVLTSYEPINNISDNFQFWTDDFFQNQSSYSPLDFDSNSYAFNHAQRQAHGDDFSFTIFVANAANDSDGRFQLGGSFTGAFSFAGGRFIVLPSTRPVGTFAHEIGHMFWAYDEYPGGRSYYDYRGYYNTQNLNGYTDNPNLASRVASIMSNGTELTTAYSTHTSSASTLAMIGWQDSDHDGIFDVLDVPFSLTGYGSFDSGTGVYHFVGNSSVQTLPNLNPDGIRNDITINRISRAQYRIDGGAWQTAALYGGYTANLDLSIGGLVGAHTVEIRTIDDRTGVASAVFQGTTTQSSQSLQPGINGFVWNDANHDGQRNADELGYSGWSVQLVDNSNQVLALRQTFEPDNYLSDTLLNTVRNDVSLTAIGAGVVNTQVLSRDATPASTGSRVFGYMTDQGAGTLWSHDSRRLKISFTQPTNTVSIDAIASAAGDYGRLEIYNAQNQLLDRFTSAQLAAGQVTTMTLSRSSPDIAYAIAGAHAGTTVRLDDLQFGSTSLTTTDSHGGYSFAYLPAGTYNVKVVPPQDYITSQPASGVRTVSLTAGQTLSSVDFAAQPGTNNYYWHNAVLAWDVDGNGHVNNLDAYALFSHLKVFGAHNLVGQPGIPVYLYDVVADGVVNNLDAYTLSNYLRQHPGGESFGPTAGDLAGGSASSTGGLGEGEGFTTGYLPGPRLNASPQTAPHQVGDPVQVLDPENLPGHSNPFDDFDHQPVAGGFSYLAPVHRSDFSPTSGLNRSPSGNKLSAQISIAAADRVFSTADRTVPSDDSITALADNYLAFADFPNPSGRKHDDDSAAGLLDPLLTTEAEARARLERALRRLRESLVQMDDNTARYGSSPRTAAAVAPTSAENPPARSTDQES